MPEANTVFDNKDNIVALAKFGVGWSRPQGERLGEYDYGSKGYVYNNKRQKLASFENGIVLNMQGIELGRYSNYQLTVNNEVVGKCIGCEGVAALAIVCLFSQDGSCDNHT